METLDGKIALVTGAAGGIGLGIARALQERGAKLVVTDIDEAELRRSSATLPADTLALRHDVTDRESWGAVRREAEARFGQVDVLCNNAGVAPSLQALADVSPAAFERIININLMGVYNGIHCFAAVMRDRGSGHIVNTASSGALIAMPNMADYGASKAGVVALSEALRLEMADHGVGVSVLCPGPVASRMMDPAAQELAEVRLMDPLWAGRAVANAIIGDDLYVFTHPSYLPLVRARNAMIEAAFGDYAQPDYAQDALGGVPGEPGR